MCKIFPWRVFSCLAPRLPVPARARVSWAEDRPGGIESMASLAQPIKMQDIYTAYRDVYFFSYQIFQHSIIEHSVTSANSKCVRDQSRCLHNPQNHNHKMFTETTKFSIFGIDTFCLFCVLPFLSEGLPDINCSTCQT